MHLSARRAREINAYYHSLGEGLGQYVRPLVDQVDSNKPLSIALEEIAADKIVPQYPGDAREEAERFLGSGLGDDAEVVPLGVTGEGASGAEDVTDEALEAPDTDDVDDDVTDVVAESPDEAATAEDAGQDREAAADADLGVTDRAEGDVASGDDEA